MRLAELAQTRLCRQCRKLLTVEVLVTVLTLTLIAVFHSTASEDRLLLNLYYIGIVAAAYALVKRRALALMILVVLAAAGTTLAQIYFSAEAQSGDLLLDPIRDLAAWSVLLLLGWRLGVEAYRFQTEEHRLRIQREIEERTMATRAAALTSTSHEVRQPLSAILATTEVLLDGSAGPLKEVQQDFVSDIDESARYLLALVDDMLDYAKAESGMIRLALETVALPELIEQCVAMVEPKAKKASVTITVQGDPAVREIVADPLRLKQILINLLTNAVKFNEPGGFVRMQVRADNQDVFISVRDTGRGISPEQMEHLFDPYYQAAHGDQGMGTGLGLSIIKHLVELHGGSTTVDSVLGSGSAFTVRLPRKGSPDAAAETPLRREEIWRGIRDAVRAEVEADQESAPVAVASR